MIDIRKYKNLRVCKKWNRNLGQGFVQLEGPSLPQLMFKDGFLYKTVSMKSISTNYIQPSFAELEMFNGRRRDACGDIANLSTMCRKKGHFMKGDAVIVVSGDLKNLEGWVHNVEGSTVHIRPKTRLPVTIFIFFLSVFALEIIFLLLHASEMLAFSVLLPI